MKKSSAAGSTAPISMGRHGGRLMQTSIYTS